jgi:alpha-beta hydrolase superfamily lysophospholipase
MRTGKPPIAAAEASCTISEITVPDGATLALHRWTPLDPSGVTGLLFYVHGIQSHAGWLLETGAELARHGIATYALDRRGSGRSAGIRGDMPSAGAVMSDYASALCVARAELTGIPVTVLGQSFGASIVAALAVAGPAAGFDPDRIVYCAPALGQQRLRHGAAGRLARPAEAELERSPIGLDDKDYTDQARYLEFMANDPLMLRQLTARSHVTMIELEDSYLGHRAATVAEVYLARPESDPIIVLAEAERVARALHGEQVLATSFACAHHYLEFSLIRREYWSWLAEVVLRRPRDARTGRRWADGWVS